MQPRARVVAGGLETELGWTGWSDPSFWEWGLLASQDWTAPWIEPVEKEDNPTAPRPTQWLRRSFTAPTFVRAARLHVTAHGIYEAHLNGERVGDLELTPGYTQYEHRLHVQTYDVTDLIRAGLVNDLAVEVSDDWWRGQVGLFRATDQWGARTGLLAQLEVEDESGARVVVATDSWWESARSGHFADLIEGELIDLVRPGPVQAWRPVDVAEHDLATLAASPAPPVRRVQELPARTVWRVGDA